MNYVAILDDPDIDAVYIALPNGLHFEWAVKALQHGKHVLLEKPSVSNAEEAEKLFRSPLLGNPDSPVLLEAVHTFFDPTWRYFMSQIRPADVVHASHTCLAPKGTVALDDIRYNYDLAGGAMMDIGPYAISSLRSIFAAEPEECIKCDVKTAPAPASDRCDGEYSAELRFPNGGIGSMHGNYAAPWSKARLPKIEVRHRAMPAGDDDGSLKPGQEKTVTRKVTFYGHMFATLYNRIDTEDLFEVRNKDTKLTVKQWTVKTQKGVHAFREIGLDQPGEVYWKSYRYQLEQFVHRVRGREGDGTWVSAESSVAEMRAIDMVYKKSGLGVRPSRQP